MFLIRKATPADFQDIANIHFKSWHTTYLDLLPESYVNDKNNLCKKTKMWQGLMTHPDVIVWVAYDTNANNIVGFIGYFADNTHYEITTMYVLPDYHGLGIGTKLMQTSLQTLLDSHINIYVCLWVLENNTPAINFYKKFGFVHNGENSEECYENTRIIDIKLVKNLTI
ncbi:MULTISPECIES: GNAT family N-acetyltransferase [unclassified Psychrobacter]|uniref:GNAT family N-acetyltransferase n=1 Tax=unclassified Psychrobacter TaxID=196806 RepID=UPI0025B2AED0|nr:MULTISPECIES: GNAT family N-acetyltransferase [unclassified Psychrobacter]MDN3452107.1 GNAT family N-acetyltransferase [Psychrobacter sp. APC 3350]MDN3502410.1 GNAT family N-acetyltransferase [Psychrobacter sp. 5A.1]